MVRVSLENTVVANGEEKRRLLSVVAKTFHIELLKSTLIVLTTRSLQLRYMLCCFEERVYLSTI